MEDCDLSLCLPLSELVFAFLMCLSSYVNFGDAGRGDGDTLERLSAEPDRFLHSFLTPRGDGALFFLSSARRADVLSAGAARKVEDCRGYSSFSSTSHAISRRHSYSTVNPTL